VSVPKITELKSEPIVGKFYLVPCVTGQHFVNPIIPVWHSDVEIGIEAEHYHMDVRFLSDKELESYAAKYAKRYTRAMDRMGHIVKSNWPDDHTFEWKRRKCYRTMPEMPRVIHFDVLEKKYIGKKVLCGKCPHRGFPVESLPKDEKGFVICNGHGLKIDTNKGEVVKR